MFVVEAAGPCGGCLQAGRDLPLSTPTEWELKPGTSALYICLCMATGENKEYLFLCTLGDRDCLLFTDSQMCSHPPIFAALQRAPWSIPSFSYCPCKSKQLQVDIKWIFRKPSYLGIIHLPPLHKMSSALKGAAGIQYGFLVITDSDRCCHTSLTVKI